MVASLFSNKYHAKCRMNHILLPQEINYLTDEARSYGMEYVTPILWYSWLWTGDSKYYTPIANSGWGDISALGTKEILIDAYTKFLQDYDLNEYIFKEGSIWTDRIYYRPDLIQQSRLGGVALNRSQRFVSDNPLFWKFSNDTIAQKVAIHVYDKTATSFKVDFFNTEKQEVKVDMVGFELLGGTWTLKQIMNGKKKTSKITFGRGQRVALNLPPFASYQIEMNLEGQGVDFNLKTDIGVGKEDI